jgi:hypothetical protein
MSQDARRDEEQSTQKRAQILGLSYTDVSQIENKQIFRDVLTNAELYNMKVIPLFVDKSHITFGITNTTSHA